MAIRRSHWPQILWDFCKQVREEQKLSHERVSQMLWKLVNESEDNPASKELALKYNLIASMPDYPNKRVPSQWTVRDHIVGAHKIPDSRFPVPVDEIDEEPAISVDSIERLIPPVATVEEEERDIKLIESDIYLHLKAIVVGLRSKDLCNSLRVPSPEFNVGYGPGYLEVEAASSSVEDWSTTLWAKWAGDHHPELPIGDLMEEGRKDVKGYSRAMRNVECPAIKGSQALGFVWDRDDANADYRFSDDLWGVGIHFPQSCGRIVEKPIGQIEVESLGDGRAIFRPCWLYENSGVRPVAEATSLSVMEPAKEIFESDGEKWVGHEGVRYLITTYYHAKRSMDEFKSAILATNVDDLNGGRCPAYPLN